MGPRPSPAEVNDGQVAMPRRQVFQSPSWEVRLDS